MLDVVDLFREKGTRDELGLGSIRDAFADLLFPGTSTIQTRARYFLFVPWIYRALERKRVASSEVSQRARREEVALINALADAGERDGVIGIDVREKLKRLPSSVYWQGLGAWGVRLFGGSQDQYHRALDRLYVSGGAEVRTDDRERVEGGVRPNWDPRLPDPPEGFPRGVRLSLTRSEAEYLRDRIAARCPGTLLSWLTGEAKPWKPVEFPWEHPDLSAFPARSRELLDHARNFSEAFHGAALLYNLELAKEARSEELTVAYREHLADWRRALVARADALGGWSEARFWQLVRGGESFVGSRTEAFVSAWLDLLRGAEWSPRDLEGAAASRLIRARERTLKGELSRFDNRRALELWSGAAGAGQINFRWPKTERIVLDILEGLRGGNGRA